VFYVWRHELTDDSGPSSPGWFSRTSSQPLFPTSCNRAENYPGKAVKRDGPRRVKATAWCRKSGRAGQVMHEGVEAWGGAMRVS
jgi:hypothetical protein